jgi:hypothetical protein
VLKSAVLCAKCLKIACKDKYKVQTKTGPKHFQGICAKGSILDYCESRLSHTQALMAMKLT